MFILFPRLRLRISVFALPAFVLMLWCEGALPFTMLILSAICHELGHIGAMLATNHRPRRIDILPMGALIVCPEGICHRDDFKIALAGPLVSLVLALLFSAGFALQPDLILLYGAVINAVLGLFNLMPVGKLDGGKALRCFLEMKCKNEKTAERFCSAASVIARAIILASVAFGLTLSELNFGVLVLSMALIIQL